MFTVTWTRLSDGRAIRDEEYATAEEAIAEAQEPPFFGLNEGPVEIIVRDEKGVVIFPTGPADV